MFHNVSTSVDKALVEKGSNELNQLTNRSTWQKLAVTGAKISETNIKWQHVRKFKKYEIIRNYKKMRAIIWNYMKIWKSMQKKPREKAHLNCWTSHCRVRCSLALCLLWGHFHRSLALWPARSRGGLGSLHFDILSECFGMQQDAHGCRMMEACQTMSNKFNNSKNNKKQYLTLYNDI